MSPSDATTTAPARPAHVTPVAPAQARPAQDRPAQDRPAQDRPAQDRPALDRPARPGPADRAARIAGLVDALTTEVDAALDDGAVAALVRHHPDAARRLVAVAARGWAVAVEEDATAPDGADLTPTEAVVLATTALRAHDLNPFDLALWFSRDARRSDGPADGDTPGSSS